MTIKDIHFRKTVIFMSDFSLTELQELFCTENPIFVKTFNFREILLTRNFLL